MKPKRAFYDVTPQNHGWLVHLASDGVTEWYPDKAYAVARARELGRRHDEWRVRVYSESGSVEQELTSAEAPYS